MISLLVPSTIILWVAFIAITKIVNDARSRKELEKWQIAAVYAFVAIDVLYNYTYGAILFWEFARNDRKTLTARLKGYLREQPESWRGKLAEFMCKYMIEPWDPGHCGLR